MNRTVIMYSRVDLRQVLASCGVGKRGDADMRVAERLHLTTSRRMRRSVIPLMPTETANRYADETHYACFISTYRLLCSNQL